MELVIIQMDVLMKMHAIIILSLLVMMGHAIMEILNAQILAILFMAVPIHLLVISILQPIVKQICAFYQTDVLIQMPAITIPMRCAMTIHAIMAFLHVLILAMF